MMNDSRLQKQFFEQIKAGLPAQLSLVDEVATRLEISNDSAYRRIRGEKPLTITELQHLSQAFQISLDALFNVSSENVIFHYQALDQSGISFENYLQSIYDDFEQLLTFRDKQVIYAANDISLFHTLQVPEIAAFKFFFWKKTTMGFRDLKDERFVLQDLEEPIARLRWKILDFVTKVPLKDILYANAFSSTLRQIEFYWEGGLFEKKEDAITLCEKMKELILHIKQEAELGYNFIYGMEPNGQPGTYELYYNEVVLIGDAVLVRTDHGNTTYLTNNAINILRTTDADFYANTEQYLNNLMSKSVLISSVSEKERNKFFMRIERRIEQLKEKIAREEMAF